LAISHKLLKQSVSFLTFLSLSITSGQVSAIEWATGCGRTNQESEKCRNIKGDAILAGVQGTLHTVVFPDGDKYQYFYTGGTICNLEGLKVKKVGQPWFRASEYCSEENRMLFQLPSNGTFFWVDTSVD
jgi:hypothetical protein